MFVSSTGAMMNLQLLMQGRLMQRARLRANHIGVRLAGAAGVAAAYYRAYAKSRNFQRLLSS